MSKQRKTDLILYIRTMCAIYYNKRSEFYKNESIRVLINNAKKEIGGFTHEQK